MGVSPAIDLPAASFAVIAKRSTSPVRASTWPGVIVSDESDAAATVSGMRCATPPVLATIAVVPALSAVTNPVAVTLATAGFSLFHVIRSLRASPLAE